jgi:SAM-dependent methyltransferase
MQAYVETPISRSLTDRLYIFRAIMGELAPRLPAKAKVVDLGCGHCLFLQAARDLGYDATGIDARIDRVPPDLRAFVHQAKVQDADLDRYDLILCLGLLYHLELEDQIRLVERFHGQPAIVDTHYGTKTAVKTIGTKAYAGSIYHEGNQLTSSCGNRESFWPCEEDLVAILGTNHFVLKWLPEHAPGRSFYVLIPRP